VPKTDTTRAKRVRYRTCEVTQVIGTQNQRKNEMGYHKTMVPLLREQFFFIQRVMERLRRRPHTVVDKIIDDVGAEEQTRRDSELNTVESLINHRRDGFDFRA